MQRWIFRVIRRRYERCPGRVRYRLGVAIQIGLRHGGSWPPESIVILGLNAGELCICVDDPDQSHQPRVVGNTLAVGIKLAPVAWEIGRRGLAVKERQVAHFGGARRIDRGAHRFCLVEIVRVSLARQCGRSRCAKLRGAANGEWFHEWNVGVQQRRRSRNPVPGLSSRGVANGRHATVVLAQRQDATCDLGTNRQAPRFGGIPRCGRHVGVEGVLINHRPVGEQPLQHVVGGSYSGGFLGGSSRPGMQDDRIGLKPAIDRIDRVIDSDMQGRKVDLEYRTLLGFGHGRRQGYAGGRRNGGCGDDVPVLDDVGTRARCGHECEDAGESG